MWLVGRCARVTVAACTHPALRWRVRVQVHVRRGVEVGGRLPCASTKTRRYLHGPHEERAVGEQPPLGRDTDGDRQIAPDVGEHRSRHTEALRGLPLLAIVQESPRRHEREDAPHNIDLVRGWVGIGQKGATCLDDPLKSSARGGGGGGGNGALAPGISGRLP